MNLRQTGERIRRLLERERGQVLIEVLIALAILGLMSTAFLGAMYTSLQSARVAEEQAVSLTIAKTQIEFARKQGYSESDWNYTVDTSSSSTQEPTWWATATPPPIPAEHTGYSAVVTGVSDVDVDGDGSPDAGIRTITATVQHSGDVTFTLKDYEVDR